MLEQQTRRKFLLRTGQVLAGLAVVDQVPRLAELTDTSSDVRFVEGQEKRFPSESGVLVLGGLTTRSAEMFAEALTPSLEVLGPIMYAEYAKDDLDVGSLGKDLVRLQEKTGMNRLSFYGLSTGTQVAGELVEHIGDRFQFDHIFMDCTPTSLEDTDAEAVAKLLGKTTGVYDGGFGITAYSNFSVYGNPFESGASWPGLTWDQFESAKGGRKSLASLAEIVKRDNTHVVLLTPLDPAKDEVVDSEEAEYNLRGFFPNMDIYRLGGNQAHANPTDNPIAYNEAIKAAIAN